MRRVLILGAGGHAHVVADILLRMRNSGGGVQPIGFLDDRPQLAGQSVLGLPVLGRLSSLPDIPHDAAIIAIGDNRARCRIFAELAGQGETFDVARHPSATVASDARIGAGSVICAGAIVNPASVVGENVILNTACSVDHHNTIGDHAHIAPGAHLGGDVRIGEGALIGIGATILPQRAVGAWSVIAAGSVVTKNVADGVVAAGAPARIVRKLDATRTQA